MHIKRSKATRGWESRRLLQVICHVPANLPSSVTWVMGRASLLFLKRRDSTGMPILCIVCGVKWAQEKKLGAALPQQSYFFSPCCSVPAGTLSLEALQPTWEAMSADVLFSRCIFMGSDFSWGHFSIQPVAVALRQLRLPVPHRGAATSQPVVGFPGIGECCSTLCRDTCCGQWA